ncbi:hypothetical protein SVIOM74S_02184 [Streptomyces violarus]
MAASVPETAERLTTGDYTTGVVSSNLAMQVAEPPAMAWLSKAVRPGVRAVVIGGGLLGVSAARALAMRGAQVGAAQQERLMERQFDPAASKLVKRHLTDLGVEVHTECRVRDVRCVGGAVRSVEMADGFALDADLVVVACGVRPRVGSRRPPASTSARASSSTTSCAPPTRTSTPSGTAPSTTASSTASPLPHSNRRTRSRSCSPATRTPATPAPAP